jgi:hypothetical protein
MRGSMTTWTVFLLFQAACAFDTEGAPSGSTEQALPSGVGSAVPGTSAVSNEGVDSADGGLRVKTRVVAPSERIGCDPWGCGTNHRTAVRPGRRRA